LYSGLGGVESEVCGLIGGILTLPKRLENKSWGFQGFDILYPNIHISHGVWSASSVHVAAEYLKALDSIPYKMIPGFDLIFFFSPHMQ
jgi:hypothetical protein